MKHYNTYGHQSKYEKTLGSTKDSPGKTIRIFRMNQFKSPRALLGKPRDVRTPWAVFEDGLERWDRTTGRWVPGNPSLMTPPPSSFFASSSSPASNSTSFFLFLLLHRPFLLLVFHATITSIISMVHFTDDFCRQENKAHNNLVSKQSKLAAYFFVTSSWSGSNPAGDVWPDYPDGPHLPPPPGVP